MGLISRVSSRTYRNFFDLKNPQTIHHGTNARTRQGYELQRSPIRPKGAKLAPNEQGRYHRVHRQALQEGLPTIRHRCPDPRPVRCQPEKYVTGNKILRVLKSQGIQVDIPEDLYFLIKKAVSVRKHLEKNRKDKHGKFRLILIESRIHRLARYYKTQQVLAPTWKYDSSTASALVA